MNQEIKKISSEELIEELVDRNVLEKIEVGIYKPFNLIPKYGNRAIYDAIFLFHKE